MVTLAPLGDAFDPALELPLAGADGETRIYRIEAPTAELGLWVQRRFARARKLSDTSGDDADALLERIAADQIPPGADPDADETGVEHLFLGGAFDRMVGDGVSWPAIKHAGATTVIWIGLGDDAAVEFWQSVSRPPEPAPNRAERRKTSTGTGAAATTRKRASGTGTSSPKGSSRGRRAKPRT